MSIVSSENKILKILKKLRESLKNFSPSVQESNLRDFISIMERELKLDENHYDFSKFSSFLIPIEDIKAIPSNFFKENLNKKVALEYLKTSQSGVLAFDGSMHNLSRHFNLAINVINVGYWYQNYGSLNYGYGNDTEVLLEIPTNEVVRIKSKEFEYAVAFKVSKKLQGDYRFIFYDESFNVNFTLTWDVDSREQYVRLLSNHLSELVKEGIIPVSIFYTSSIDLTRAVKSLKNNIKVLEGLLLDKTIMNTYLDVGERSSLFKVYSRALSTSGLELYAFYLKLGERNVVRVEFPAELKQNVSVIHDVILAQSILGEGYPIAMQRAHEWAVLTPEDRYLIEQEVARYLGIPYVEMAYSKKLRSKRGPIA